MASEKPNEALSIMERQLKGLRLRMQESTVRFDENAKILSIIHKTGQKNTLHIYDFKVGKNGFVEFEQN